MKIRGSVVGTNQKPEKVLTRATKLTEEQKAQARDNIGAASVDQIGSIDSALDAIIAIQNSLIGGGEV